MLWEDYQLSIVDPSSATDCPSWWSGRVDSRVSAGSPGSRSSPTWARRTSRVWFSNSIMQFNDNWLFGMNFEEIEAETDTSHDLNGDDIIDINDGDLVKGLRLPLVPDYKAAAWLEYRQAADIFGGEEFFIRTQWSMSGDSVNLLEPLPEDHPNRKFDVQGYTIGDLRFGLVGEDWQFDVFINNITDERALYTINTGQYEWGAAQIAEGRMHHQSVYTNRPREAGVRFMKRWGD